MCARRKKANKEKMKNSGNKRKPKFNKTPLF